MPGRADGSLSRGDEGTEGSRGGGLSRLAVGRRALLRLGLQVLALSIGAGCAGHSAPVTSGGPARPPWEIPADALGTQRLYRLSYSGPEGEGSFRVTLRFATPERYQLQAVDPLGRALFSLDVVAGAGVLLNHRSRSYCRFQGSFETEDLPLGPFPLVALPTLLLDRIPVAPLEPVPLRDSLDFVDAEGRSWAVSVGPEGAPLSWSLRTGNAPTAWWLRRDGWSILSDRVRGVQIKWRQVVVEPLPGEIPPLPVPEAYREKPCGAPDLPEPGGAEPGGKTPSFDSVPLAF